MTKRRQKDYYNNDPNYNTYDPDYDSSCDTPSHRRKKKTHRLYAFVVLVLGLVILSLAVVLLFYIQRIEVVGNEYSSDRNIIKTVQNDKYSVNSLYVYGKYALGYGETLPCLEELKIGFSLPWVLRVEVKEKQIIGFFYSGDQEYAYFDKDGLIVKKDSTYIEGVPYVEGIGVEDIKLYEPIKSEKSKIFKEILEASQELKKYELETEKIVCEKDRIFLYIGQICVSLGNNVTSEKIAQITPIIEKLEGKTGTLHLENYSEGRETITFDIEEISQEN